MVSFKRMSMFSILIALSVVWVGPAMGQGQVLLSEDFDSLPLGPFPTEGGGDGTDWTDTPPSGWVIDNSKMTAEGRPDWQGWTIADALAWAQVDDQNRSDFSLANGAAVIADPDEWDDQNSPASTGRFNSFIRTPSISLSGVTATNGTIQFYSSWRPYAAQKGTVTVSFDGGNPIEVLHFSSDASSPNYKDDNSRNEFIRVPFEIPSNASSMVVTWGLENAGNDWWWAFDNVVIVTGHGSPTVTRSFESPLFEADSAVAVSLDVVLETGWANTSVVETLPPGWTAQNISHSGFFADDKIIWTMSGFSGTQTLTYEAVSPASPADSVTITGMVNGAFEVMGEGQLSLIRPIGMFTNHIDVGNIGGAPGSAEYDAGRNEYVVTGSGSDIWGSADGMHFAFMEVNGAFSFKVDEIFVEVGNGDAEWTKCGLMVRDNLTAGSANAFAMLHGVDQGYRPQHRPSQDGGSAGNPPDLDFAFHFGAVELERIGNQVNYYFIDSETGERTLHSSAAINDLQDPVFLGLAVTSHSNGQLSSGYFTNPQFTQYHFEASRDLPTEFAWRETLTGITLTVNIYEGETANITITETVPEGWSVSNVVASSGNTNVSGNEITWTLSGASGEQTLTYDTTPPGEDLAGNWSGVAVSGDINATVIGPNKSFANPPSNFQTIFFEDFEGLASLLGPAEYENHGDGTDWTHTPPEGWEIDNNVPANGAPEWEGWSFADKDFWINTDGQRREEFTRGKGIVATVDPDEWDDQSGHDPGTYNSSLSTPPISIPEEAESLILTFDSSWRPEDDQKARLEVAFDGGGKIEIFNWVSDAGAPDFKDDNSTNEALFMPIEVPQGASEMVITWTMYDAGNDWWWTIDNIKVAVEGLPIQPVAFPYSENFESVSLGPNREEGVSGDAVWSNVPPSGWTVDNSGVYGADQGLGVDEWIGWTFAEKDWWIEAAEDQQRSQFTKGSGTVAIADPDEWDDKDSPGDSGVFTSFLSTPPILLDGVAPNTAVLTFDSSWRDEDAQKVNITVTYDDGDPIEVLRWVSNPTDSPNFHNDAPNETISVPLNNPAGASQMVVTFGMLDAGNDWWWAIDNIVITDETSVDAWSLY